MRLRSSGDRHEVRLSYLPVLWDMLVRRLVAEGKEAVDDVIAVMDQYFLTREDWDAVLELGVGSMDMEGVKIETAAKSAFTRVYVAHTPFFLSSLLWLTVCEATMPNLIRSHT